MIRVAILGSCATGDAFAYESPALEEVFFHSHTSLISLNSPPVAIANDAISWASPYAHKRLFAELQRTVVTDLAQTRPDAVVFDLIDERFDLLRCGSGYVTDSDELCQSRALEDLAYSFERVSRLSTEVTRLFESSAVTIADQVRNLLPRACLVLHRAFWAEEYTDVAQVLPLWGSMQREAVEMNEMLKDYYSWFEENVPGVHAVELQHPRRAFAQHRRGLRPFHFEPTYYEELLCRITETVTARPYKTFPERKPAQPKPWDDTFSYWIETGRAKGVDPNDIGDEEWNDPKSHVEQIYMPHIRPDSMVLELGPGTGRITRHIIGRCREMILVDYSDLACRWLDQYLNGRGDFRTFHIVMPAIPEVADVSVDFAFAFGVMEHIDLDGMRSYLEEFYRVLVIGGTVIFNFDNIMTAEGLAWHDRSRRIANNPRAFHFYHPETVVWLAKSAGFTVTALRTGDSRHAEIEVVKRRSSR